MRLQVHSWSLVSSAQLICLDSYLNILGLYIYVFNQSTISVEQVLSRCYLQPYLITGLQKYQLQLCYSSNQNVHTFVKECMYVNVKNRQMVVPSSKH